MTLPSLRVVADDDRAPADWDARAVAVPGGHVMQSITWADYRSRGATKVRFVTFDDGSVALVTLRRSRGLPGVEASVRRGPAHRGDAASTRAARAMALAAWAGDVGARDLFLDPEVGLDAAYEAAMEAAGFEMAEEREPSIHVMRLELPVGLTEETLWGQLSKSTRQRVRSARDAGVRVRETTDEGHILAFDELLHERADVLGIALAQGGEYRRGWRLLIDEGLARLLLAEHEGEVVGGLLLYRQGGIHATAYSADRAARREDLPGTMHLVRWSAVSDALAEGAAAIELGGVDLPGHREPPQQGDPGRGLYEHKRGFGAEWVERSPARRIVLRPGADRLARARRRAIDGIRRLAR